MLFQIGISIALAGSGLSKILNFTPYYALRNQAPVSLIYLFIYLFIIYFPISTTICHCLLNQSTHIKNKLLVLIILLEMKHQRE